VKLTPEIKPARHLRNLLAGSHAHIGPGVATALHAKLAQRAGFEVMFTTGSGIANTFLGLPDVGLATMTEVVMVVRRIVQATSLPVIADADTGYGNHLNVYRTVQELEHAGVAGLIIEDQWTPKRCGHFTNKRVISSEEMVQKIKAAQAARLDPDLVLIARTDSVSIEGLEGALHRGQAYARAGADVVFIEAPTTIDAIARIPPAIPVPCMINMVEGGLTPIVRIDQLEALGFKLVVYGNVALRVAAKAVQRAFKRLVDEGSSIALIDEMIGWDERQDIVGLPFWEQLDQAARTEDMAGVEPTP
jgi:2-methylisocitrate lyase-like PEP mutase family enzyme